MCKASAQAPRTQYDLELFVGYKKISSCSEAAARDGVLGSFDRWKETAYGSRKLPCNLLILHMGVCSPLLPVGSSTYAIYSLPGGSVHVTLCSRGGQLVECWYGAVTAPQCGEVTVELACCQSVTCLVYRDSIRCAGCLLTHKTAEVATTHSVVLAESQPRCWTLPYVVSQQSHAHPCVCEPLLSTLGAASTSSSRVTKLGSYDTAPTVPAQAQRAAVCCSRPQKASPQKGEHCSIHPVVWVSAAGTQ